MAQISPELGDAEGDVGWHAEGPEPCRWIVSLTVEARIFWNVGSIILEFSMSRTSRLQCPASTLRGVDSDDAQREFSYDHDSQIHKLDTSWDKAAAEGWIIVSMKDDWNRVFPFGE